MKDIACLVNVFHPSLWSNRGYSCCGSNLRSSSKVVSGCRSVSWSPSSLQPHMGIHFSHFIHPPSSSPGTTAKAAIGTDGDSMAKSPVDGAATGEPPASPSTSHSNALISGTHRWRVTTQKTEETECVAQSNRRSSSGIPSSLAPPWRRVNYYLFLVRWAEKGFVSHAESQTI